MVSIREVAELAGVSVGTVSKYLNTPHRVAPATSDRVRLAIKDLGYVRNEAARQMRTGRSNTLAFVALELRNPFFGEVAHAVERRAAENGLFLVLASSDGDPVRESQYIDMFVQQRVRGLILASGTTGPEDLELLAARDIPTVLVDAYAPSDRFSSVAVDDALGTRRAVIHLIEQGCRSIAFVGGPASVRQIGERLDGARKAVREHPGVTLEVIPTDERIVTAGLHVGEAIAARRPAERPDGIVAANDSVALGLMQSLGNRAGLRVPADIALVGFDDMEFAATTTVPLTTVRRPRDIFGRTAVDLVRDQAEADGPLPVRTIVIQPELIVRESSLRRGRPGA
ncbi:LacI family transcriptional regulator [Streptomyces sp. NBC_00825]|uniref:LacI family DNA-binding transcriptional regulator n=1 Tax=unclassified Streptomyces TaxID=2593676 RepID=UPI002ED3EE57|nr:LacI family transcriptional regulator [Streptomyces sp. NBC_00826]WTH88773.1 LacI family transcriptional regulator [Streptomyces sp. NBC_00825]WTH97503.1 LacI family transcriptional regulator [Streptomyces sp. NBC_00822]